MQRSNIISAVGIAALLLGCSDQPAPTDTGIAPLQLSASTGQVVQSVTGSGHFLFPGPEGAQRIFTDVAHTFADGTVDGQWRRATHFVGGGAPMEARGVITCMRIDGNTAYLGGYATSGVGSEPPNNGVVWYVVDNGEGANAEPDILSLQFVRTPPDFPDGFCATGEPRPSAFPIVAGNIQVNP